MLYQIIFMLSSIFTCGAASSEEIDLSSKVTAVTVYSQEAFVTRETRTVIPENSSQIYVVRELSRFIDRGSINVKLNGIGIINSIKFIKTPIVEEIDSSALIDLEPLIINKKDSIADIENDLITLQATKEYLDKSKPIQHEEFKLSSPEFKEAYSFYREEIKDVNKEIFLLTNQKEILLQSVADLETPIKPTRKEQPPTYDLMINFISESNTPVSFQLNYKIGRVGWYSTYDLRADSIGKPIQLVHKAIVSQTNGELWDDVLLSLSNDQTQYSKDIPVLDPFYLPPVPKPSHRIKRSTRTTPQIPMGGGPQVSGKVIDGSGEPLIGVNVLASGTSIGTITNIDGTYSLTLPTDVSSLEFSYIGFESQTRVIDGGINNLTVILEEHTMLLDEVVVTGSTTGYSSSSREVRQRKVKPEYKYSVPKTKVEESLVNFKFTLDSRYTIPNDGQPSEITVRSVELPCDYKYVVVPAITEAVYLVAYIGEWEDKNLLPGEMNLFFEDTFVGNSLLNPNQYADSIQVSLGVDSKIQVQRKRDDFYNRKSTFKTKKYTEMSFTTTVKNLRDEEINVEIIDQIPVSSRKGIEIKDVVTTQYFDINEKTGIGKWDFVVPRLGSKKVKLSYTVKYPNNYTFDFY